MARLSFHGLYRLISKNETKIEWPIFYRFNLVMKTVNISQIITQ